MSTPLSFEDQVIVALRRITRASDLHSRGLLQGIDLTAPQLASLQAINRLQPVTIGGLAKAIHLSQATLTGILTRLESRALVTRTRSGSDWRTVFVELTDAGPAVIESAPSLLQSRFRSKLLALKEWEQTQMLATLQQIASRMATDDFEVIAESTDVEPVLDDNHVAAIAKRERRDTCGTIFAEDDCKYLDSPNPQLGEVVQ